MLKKRLVTVLTFNDGVLFRTKNFVPDYRYTTNFVDAWSVDEVILLDITRPGDGDRSNFYGVIGEFARNCFIPVAAGGGVTDTEGVSDLLRAGADKVVINSEALKRPEFITEMALIFGSQCVVVSIDARKDGDSYEVFSEYGTCPTGFQPQDWARKAEECGAGELMVTSIEKDGSLQGYDNKLNRIVAETVDIPVLVCGGAGRWQHFVDGFNDGLASAVCTTNIYHFTETSISSAKSYIQSAGIDVRI